MKKLTDDMIEFLSTGSTALKGADYNTEKLIEEMGELLQALIKHKHKKTEKTRVKLIDEMSDVYLCLRIAQFRAGQKDCDKQTYKKFNRSIKRLETLKGDLDMTYEDATAAEVEKAIQENRIGYINHHLCSGCAVQMKFVINGSDVFFSTNCNCETVIGKPIVKSFQDITDWINGQEEQEIKFKIARRCGLELEAV